MKDATMQSMVRIGAIVQVDPDESDRYAGQFIIVTEIKEWGIQGYLAVTMEDPDLVRWKGIAYVRMAWDKIWLVGFAEWLQEDIEEVEGQDEDDYNQEPRRPER